MTPDVGKNSRILLVDIDVINLSANMTRLFSPHVTSLHRTNVANWIILSSSMYAAGRILVKLYHETVVGSVYGKLARKMVVGETYEQKVITNWITPKNAHLSSL